MTDQHRAEATLDCPSRSLVVVAAAEPISGGADRPDAEFLAQLIACKRRLPAYRVARRASPDRAASAYATAPAGPEATVLNRIV